jgi:hypothetical protein
LETGLRSSGGRMAEFLGWIGYFDWSLPADEDGGFLKASARVMMEMNEA